MNIILKNISLVNYKNKYLHENIYIIYLYLVIYLQQDFKHILYISKLKYHNLTFQKIGNVKYKINYKVKTNNMKNVLIIN